MARPPRNVTLLDTIILVAATAAGMALIRSGVSDFQSHLFFIGRFRWISVVMNLIWLSWNFLIVWGAALLVIRLLPPRPRLRKVLRQPGTVACCAMILAMSIHATYFVILSSTMGAAQAHRDVHLESPYLMNPADGSQVAFSVMGAWLTLVLIGRWRPERDWIDRLGRALGYAWIAGYLTVKAAWLFVALVWFYKL